MGRPIEKGLLLTFIFTRAPNLGSFVIPRRYRRGASDDTSKIRDQDERYDHSLISLGTMPKESPGDIIDPESHISEVVPGSFDQRSKRKVDGARQRELESPPPRSVHIPHSVTQLPPFEQISSPFSLQPIPYIPRSSPSSKFHPPGPVIISIKFSRPAQI